VVKNNLSSKKGRTGRARVRPLCARRCRAFRAAEYVNKGTRRPIRGFFSDRRYQYHLSPRRRWRCHPRLSVKSLSPVRQLQ
jgi:hypothetical protein